MKAWISVKDKMPEEVKRVLCVTNTGMLSVGYYYDNEWWWDSKSVYSKYSYTITHWIPLPKPPQTKEVL